jgi:hypothetical protein
VTGHIAPHPFDTATRVERIGSRCRGAISDAYWAFVGLFGGVTSATVLRAVLEDEARIGDPLALTVNFRRLFPAGASTWNSRSLGRIARRSTGRLS